MLGNYGSNRIMRFGFNLDLNSLCKMSFNNKAYFTQRIWAKVEPKWINPIGVVNEINPRTLHQESRLN